MNAIALQWLMCEANTQGELHPLEEGMHALGSGMSQRAYADAVGKKPTPIAMRMQAARVAQVCSDIGALALKDRWNQLAELHAAPSWLWPALAAELVARGWTVEATRGKVAALKDVPEPPEWADQAAIAEAIVTGAMKAAGIVCMAAVVANATIEDEDLRRRLVEDLKVARQPEPRRSSRTMHNLISL